MLDFTQPVIDKHADLYGEAAVPAMVVTTPALVTLRIVWAPKSVT